VKSVSALILAAGQGTRASGFKPLLDWRGESFVAKVYRSLRESGGFQKVLVVTGFADRKIQAELTQMGAPSVYNANHAQGMHSSIKAGVHQLASGPESPNGLLVALVDQPHLGPEDFRPLVRAFQTSDRSLIRPTYKARFGNPCILGADHFKEILAEPDLDRGCAYLFQRHPERVLAVEMADDKCLVDFDSAEDLKTIHEWA